MSGKLIIVLREYCQNEKWHLNLVHVWCIMVHYGTYMVRYGVLWCIMVHYGTRMVHYGTSMVQVWCKYSALWYMYRSFSVKHASIRT